MENDPSARITRVSSLPASPGNCAICGKDQHPLGFADARLDFEFYGTFYLCADCIGEYARLFGFISPDEFAGMREQLEESIRTNRNLTQAVQSLESTVDNLISDAHRRRRESPLPDHVVSGSSDGDSVDEPDAEPTDANAGESDRLADDTADGSNEPSNEQGRSDVLDTDSADRLLGL